MGFQSAAEEASPVLLEPWMGVEVATPEEFLGGIINDMNARKGRVKGVSLRGNAKVLQARVPLADMFGYSTELRSASEGRATYSMEFSHYDVVERSPARERG